MHTKVFDIVNTLQYMITNVYISQCIIRLSIMTRNESMLLTSKNIADRYVVLTLFTQSFHRAN